MLPAELLDSTEPRPKFPAEDVAEWQTYREMSCSYIATEWSRNAYMAQPDHILSYGDDMRCRTTPAFDVDKAVAPCRKLPNVSVAIAKADIVRCSVEVMAAEMSQGSRRGGDMERD